MATGHAPGDCWRRKNVSIGACDTGDIAFDTWLVSQAPPADATRSLMVESQLGDFEPESWSGYACTFHDWATCVNSTASCDRAHPSCSACVSTRGGKNGSITCAMAGRQMQFRFPAGGIFPVVEQFTIPENIAIIGAASPTEPSDRRRQQLAVADNTWFVVPREDALCGDDPLCGAETRGPTACTGDPRTHRQGFLMSSNSTLMNISFQGADRGRAASEGTLCGPGAIELPGCLSGEGCKGWGGANGRGVVENVEVRHVRLSDAVRRAKVA
jgi:hypothetical protein